MDEVSCGVYRIKAANPSSGENFDVTATDGDELVARACHNGLEMDLLRRERP